MTEQKPGFIETSLQEASKKIPAMALERLLRRKLKESGVRRYKQLAAGLAEHVISGRKTPFQWGSGRDVTAIQLHFTEEDAHELESISSKLIEKIPSAVEAVTEESARLMEARLKQMWREQRYLEEREFSKFRNGIEDVWGEGLDLLRMLLVAAHDVGGKASERIQAKANFRSRSDLLALIRLHNRACQVAAEIITLLENGYPDGALARWRTLHEIASVSTVIKDAGEEVGKRYLDHEIVEEKRALDRYLVDCEGLGERPPSKRTVATVQRAFEKLVRTYGADFKTEYGWASSHLGISRPRFIDIQDAAGRASMHSHYKRASYSVHASPRAFSVRAGVIEYDDPLNAGATNAGLQEAGRGLAVSLSIITSHLFFSERANLDEVAEMKCILSIRDATIGELERSNRNLRQQELAIRRAIRDYEDEFQ